MTAMRLHRTLATLGLLAALAVVAAPYLQGQGYSNANPRAYWVSPGKCNSTVSGTASGTNGLTTTGASATPVVQAQSSATGTHTQTFICTITPPNGIITSGSGLAIVDAVFAYGPQNMLGTQSATLASGTLNSATVFSTITYPAAGAGETASTVAPVRADSGTLTIAPVVASFNATTADAGAFYTVRFTPATPIAWKTDMVQLLLTVRLTMLDGLASITNSPGVLVHFRSQ